MEVKQIGSDILIVVFFYPDIREGFCLTGGKHLIHCAI